MTKIIAGSGHRPQFAVTPTLKAFSKAQDLAMLQTAKHYLAELKADYVISGGALGWDTAIARAAFSLKIPYAVYVPCQGFGAMWDKQQQFTFDMMLRHADKHHIVTDKPYNASLMVIRDHAMVNDATMVLALWNGQTHGGTYHTVQYAKQCHKEVVNAWGYYNATY